MLDAQRPLAAFVVDYLAVGKKDVAHILAQFRLDAHGVGHFVTEDAVPRHDAAHLALPASGLGKCTRLAESACERAFLGAKRFWSSRSRDERALGA